MPTEKGNKKTLTVWIDIVALAMLDDFTKRADVSRSKLVSSIVDVYGKEMAFYQKIGFLHLAVAVRNVIDVFIKKAVKNESRPMTIWVEKSLIQKMDTIADIANITRSKLVTNVIKTAIEELKIVDDFGKLHHSKVMKNLQGRVQKSLRAAIHDEGLSLTKK